MATGSIVAVSAAVLPIGIVGELVSIGTLFAFTIVCVSVLVLRRTRPDIPRPFRVPLYPWVPVLGTVTCTYLMANLPADRWLRLLVWMAVGLVIYFSYGIRKSRLRSRGIA